DLLAGGVVMRGGDQGRGVVAVDEVARQRDRPRSPVIYSCECKAGGFADRSLIAREVISVADVEHTAAAVHRCTLAVVHSSAHGIVAEHAGGQAVAGALRAAAAERVGERDAARAAFVVVEGDAWRASVGIRD